MPAVKRTDRVIFDVTWDIERLEAIARQVQCLNARISWLESGDPERASLGARMDQLVAERRALTQASRIDLARALSEGTTPEQEWTLRMLAGALETIEGDPGVAALGR